MVFFILQINFAKIGFIILFETNTRINRIKQLLFTAFIIIIYQLLETAHLSIERGGSIQH